MRKGFTQYTPVNMTRAEFERSILLTSIRPLKDPGKMYFFYQNYLFINEKGLGVHVYDLTDISNPQKIAFMIFRAILILLSRIIICMLTMSSI